MKAAKTLILKIVTTDVGGVKEKTLISCFWGQRLERLGSGEKTNIKLNKYTIFTV